MTTLNAQLDGSTFLIRRPLDEDFPHLMAIDRDAFPLRPFGTRDFRETPTRRVLMAELAATPRQLRIPLGFLVFSDRGPFVMRGAVLDHRASLLRFAIRRDLRRRGFGRQLFTWFDRTEPDFQHIEADIPETNLDAQHFLKALDFQAFTHPKLYSRPSAGGEPRQQLYRFVRRREGDAIELVSPGWSLAGLPKP